MIKQIESDLFIPAARNLRSSVNGYKFAHAQAYL